MIRKNSDGSIDLVSEYTSTTKLYFYGKEGYKNLIGVLNQIAQSYETSGITSGSRYMGYDGQTEFIADETMLNKTTAPWTENTTATNSRKGSTRERQGGGDVLYETDTNLVKEACGNIGSSDVYWLASRQYDYLGFNGWSFRVIRVIYTGDFYSDYTLYAYAYNTYASALRFSSYSVGYYLRPIVTLKSGIQASSGDGTSGNPWKVN